MTHSLIVSANQDGIDFLRTRYLGDTWFSTDDPDVAIRELQEEVYDRLFLDYWLKQEPHNGRDVSIWLGDHKDINPRLIVYATTNDPKKGGQMVMECGRVAYHIPMGQIVALGA